MKPAQLKRGMTLIELMIYSVILIFILGFIVQMLWGSRHVESGRKRLGIFQDLRLSVQKVNMNLSQATRILFPPPDGKGYHQIVFISEAGELMVIYLNDQNNLHMINYDGYKKRRETPSLLTPRSIEFTASRPEGTEDYVQYLLRVKDEMDVEFCVSEGILVRNLIH